MSQENVEIVRRALEEFIVSDHQTVVADFVWDMSTFRGWPDRPVFHGPDGLADFMKAWRDPYDDWSMAVEEIVDAGGDKVVAVLLQRGRLPGSDVDLGQRYGVVYTVEGGEARCGQAYMTAEEALEAVGLRE
jgi:ketosteroid isomerase-like protein